MKENSWTDEIRRREMIFFLKETIYDICDRVRNKLVGPYAALQIVNEKNIPKELIEIATKNIKWLCHEYMPDIISAVNKRYNEL